MMTKHLLLALPILFTACTKGENAGSGTGAGSTPSGGATSSTTTVPIASSVATAATADPPAPTPSASTTTTASAVASANAKKDAGGAAPTKAVSTRLTGNNFALDVASPGCKVDAECPMTIRLAAQGDWHLNKEYPYKFLATAAPNITFLGKSDATTFSKQTGDFAEENEKAATLTVRFKPSKSGDATVSGTYKLSVCSADQCQIEQAKVSLTIPVM